MNGLPHPADLEALLAHRNWVKALARSLVADPATAEDVEQQTWLIALERPPKHGRNLKAWLASVTRSVAGGTWRDQKQQLRKTERLQGRLDHEPAEAPLKLAERQETFRHLAALVAELEEPYGSAIYLRYFEGLSVKEVAQQLQLPAATAQTHLHRGVALLRKRLQLRFGSSWKSRCLVFLTPIPAASSALPPLAALTMSTKTKLSFLATLLLLPLLILLYQQLPQDPKQEIAPELEGNAALPPIKEELSGMATETRRITPASESEPLEKEEGKQGGHLVQVSFADSLKAAAHAEVLYFDLADERAAAWRRDQFHDWTDQETLLDRYGTLYRADEQGRILLPPRKSFAYIGARLPGFFASVYLLQDLHREPYAQVELLLRPAHHVRVRVLDSFQQPVENFPLAYQLYYNEVQGNNLHRVRTGKDGRAVFRNLPDILSRSGGSFEHRIVPAVPWRNSPFLRFTPEKLPEKEWLIQLPPMGSVQVHCFDAQGKAVSNGTVIHLQARGEPRNSGFEIQSPLGHTMAYLDGGQTVFPFVEVGLEITAAFRPAGSKDYRFVHGRGPMRANDQAKLEIYAAAPVPPVRARLVTVNGNPIRHQTVELEFFDRDHAGDAYNHGIRLASNENGEIEFQPPLSDDQDQATISALVVIPEGGSKAGQLHWSTTEFKIQRQGSPVELEDWIVGPELVAGGLVTDHRKQPKSGVEMVLKLAWLPKEPLHEKLDRPRYLFTRTDDSGRFAFHGCRPANLEDCQIFVETKEGAVLSHPESHAIRLGADDHDFVIEPQTIVEGRILCDSDIPLQRLRLRLEVEDATGKWSRFPELESETGRFQFILPSDGKGFLVLEALSSGESLATSDTFDFAQADLKSLGWQELDLRHQLFVHRITAVGTKGEVDSPLKVVFPEVSENWIRHLPNPFSSISRSPQQRIQISASGYRPQEILARGTSEVWLPDAIRIQVWLPENLQWPDPEGWSIVATRFVSGRPTQPTMVGPIQASMEGENPSAWLSLPSEGSWQLALQYQPVNPETQKRVGFRIFAGDPKASSQEVLVRDTQEAQAWEWVVSQQEIDKVIASAQEFWDR